MLVTFFLSKGEVYACAVVMSSDVRKLLVHPYFTFILTYGRITLLEETFVNTVPSNLLSETEWLGWTASTATESSFLDI